MASINPNFYKELRNEYNDMCKSFSHIKQEYDSFEVSGYGDLFQIMYSVSDFYDAYESLDIKFYSLLKSQTLVDKQSEYKSMSYEVKSMLSEVKGIYSSVRNLAQLSGGFSDSENRAISGFRIDRLV